MLEIGTGCGYQTAVLAQIADEVYTVERIGALVAKARRNLQALKVEERALKHGDGSADLGEDLAVDAIIVTAGATHVPDRAAQVPEAGRAHGAAARAARRRRATARSGSPSSRRRPAGIREQTLDAVRFVPLLPGLA